MRQTKKKSFNTLGAGAYENEFGGKERPSKKDAQDCFLKAVRRLVPQALEDLSREPYNLYRQIPELCFNADTERLDKLRRLIRQFQTLNRTEWEGLQLSSKVIELKCFQYEILERSKWENLQRPSWEEIEKLFLSQWPRLPLAPDEESLSYNHSSQYFRGEIFGPTFSSINEPLLAFWESLSKWSVDHRLEETWCRERAYETLEQWTINPKLYEQRNWTYQINNPHPFMIREEPHFIFERRTPYPILNSRKEDFERAVREFKSEYAKFQDEIEDRFKADGYTAAPIKPLDKHFEWLVRYHIQEWKYAEIAAEYAGGDDSLLRHKIPQLAHLMGLRLKKRRGRPRNS